MCPDDWMMSAGIDLWDAAARASIEALQFELALDLLRRGRTVIIEWGVWTRSERDQLRDGARAHGATVELCYVDAPLDELWRRIVDRDLEGRWSDRSIERHEVAAWATAFEPPTDDERASYDLDTLDE